jgi:hypothetical protein
MLMAESWKSTLAPCDFDVGGAIHTQQHESLLALAQLETCLRKQHERLQGLDGRLIYVEL